MEHLSYHDCSMPADTLSLNWSELPTGLRLIQHVAGSDAALALAKAYGGTSIYVPRTISPQHPLRLLLSEEQAQALSLTFGGDRLDIPKTDAVLRQLRKRRILASRNQGASIAALATEHNLSRRRILQILAER